MLMGQNGLCKLWQGVAGDGMGTPLVPDRSLSHAALARPLPLCDGFGGVVSGARTAERNQTRKHGSGLFGLLNARILT